MDELTLEEKIAFVREATRQMAVYTHPFLCQVIGVEPDGKSGTLVGSGVRVVSGGKTYVLTAEHVVAAAKGYASVALSAGGENAPRQASLGGARFDREADLAVLPVDGEDLERWPLSTTHCDEELLSTDFLFVHGYPGAGSGFSELLRGLFSTTLPYGAMRREDDLPSDLESFQLALDFDPANFQSTAGGVADWINPHGLSGSPIWRIGIADGTAIGWAPSQASLVGIVTQWRPDAKLLIASKLDRLAPLLG
jgi:hypothetical protein